MAGHRRIASNVGVALIAISVLLMGAQTNTTVMLASENQNLAAAPGNQEKNDGKGNNVENSNPGNGAGGGKRDGTPVNSGNGSAGNTGSGSAHQPANNPAGNGGSNAPGNPGDIPSLGQNNVTSGGQQSPPPAATSVPARDNPGNGGLGGNGIEGVPKPERTVEPLPSPWPATAPTPGGGNTAQVGIHKPVGICHRTGNGLFHYLEADDDSALYQGHLQHGGDKFNVSGEEECATSSVEIVIVPSPTAAVVAPTPNPSSTPVPTMPTVGTTVSATPTVDPAAAGSPTAVTPSQEGDNNGNGPADGEDGHNSGQGGDERHRGGPDDDVRQDGRGISGIVDGESGGSRTQLREEIALSPNRDELRSLVPGTGGEVLGDFPNVPPRRPAPQAVPSSGAGGGTYVAQIPAVRQAKPALLPTTGEGDEAPIQGLAVLGMFLFASGSILTTIGRRAQI